MTESEINISAYNLVNLLEVKIRDKSIIRPFNPEKIIGVNNYNLRISQIDDFTKPVSHLVDTFGNLHAVKKHIGDNEVGLDKNNYKKLQYLANKIIELEYFNNLTDFNFIEIEIFNWVINIYETKVSTRELINYLKERVEDELHNYEFYYKVLSLGIENDFTICGIHFTSLKTEFFEEEFKKMGKDFNPHVKSFESFMQNVIAKSRTYATKERAEKKSLYNVKLALNTLKMFMLLESIDSLKLPYIESASSDTSLSFMSRDKQTNFLALQFNAQKHPTIVNDDMLNQYKSMGLDEVSNFVISKKNDALYFEIIDKINFLRRNQ